MLGISWKKQPRQRFLNGSAVLACTLIGVLFLCGAVHAYTDALDTPALKSKAAQYNLLLDVELAGNRLVAVGERGHILYSDNRGHDWVQAEVPSMAFLTAVYFPSPKQGWAVGQDTIILHTSDGGRSWSRQYDERKSDNPAPLLDVFFLNEKEGFAIGAYGKFMHTSNGGVNWENWAEHIDNIDEWHLNAFAQGTGGILYIAGESGFVYRSPDNGSTWQTLDVPHEGSFIGIVAGCRTGSVVVFGIGGKVFVTHDSGESWSEVVVDTEVGLTSGRLLEDGSVVIVGDAGVVLKADAKFENFHLTNTESMLPLSSVNICDKDSLVLTGLGGIEMMSAEVGEKTETEEDN